MVKAYQQRIHAFAAEFCFLPAQNKPPLQSGVNCHEHEGVACGLAKPKPGSARTDHGSS